MEILHQQTEQVFYISNMDDSLIQSVILVCLAYLLSVYDLYAVPSAHTSNKTTAGTE